MSNNDPLRQLMAITERVVGPVPACHRRKMRMRREMLQHVEDVYHEQLELGMNPSCALARTRERFGDPNYLTAELASSVPAFEGFSHRLNRWLERRHGDSALRFGIRSAVRFGLLMFVVLMLPYAAMYLGGWVLQRANEWPATNEFFPLIMVKVSLLFAANTFAMTWTGAWVVDSCLRRGNEVSWGAMALGGITVTLALFVTMIAVLTWNGIGKPDILQQTAGSLISGLVIFPVVLWLILAERREAIPWERLNAEPAVAE